MSVLPVPSPPCSRIIKPLPFPSIMSVFMLLMLEIWTMIKALIRGFFYNRGRDAFRRRFGSRSPGAGVRRRVPLNDQSALGYFTLGEIVRVECTTEGGMKQLLPSNASSIRDNARLEENMYSLYFLSCSLYPRIVAGRSSKKGSSGGLSESIPSGVELYITRIS